MEINELTGTVIGCAIDVHRGLGPGLLESAYEQCLLYEIRRKGIEVYNQVRLPISYKGLEIDAGYRLDLFLPDKLILELKVVDKIAPIHKAQLMSYLKLSKIKTGLLINFNETQLTHGINRISI